MQELRARFSDQCVCLRVHVCVRVRVYVWFAEGASRAAVASQNSAFPVPSTGSGAGMKAREGTAGGTSPREKFFFLIVWALKYLPEGVLIVNQYFNWKKPSS